MFWQQYDLNTYTEKKCLSYNLKSFFNFLGHREVETTMKFYIKAKAEEIGKRINLESKKLIEMPTKFKNL